MTITSSKRIHHLLLLTQCYYFITSDTTFSPQLGPLPLYSTEHTVFSIVNKMTVIQPVKGKTITTGLILYYLLLSVDLLLLINIFPLPDFV